MATRVSTRPSSRSRRWCPRSRALEKRRRLRLRLGGRRCVELFGSPMGSPDAVMTVMTLARLGWIALDSWCH